MPKIVCLRGLPGSGKSIWAKARLGMMSNDVRVNRDDLRESLFDSAGILEGWQEDLITQAEQAVADAALKAGRDVIVDAMHLRPKYLKNWNLFALERGADFEYQEFPTPVDVCVNRDHNRFVSGGRGVGEDVIREIAARYMPKGKFLPYTILQSDPELLGKFGFEDRVVVPYANPTTLPPVVLVDIDGTMALMGDRNPYDWEAVSQDKPNWPVLDLVSTLIFEGSSIVFLSGRDGSCRDATLKWLRKWLPRGEDGRWFLLMREAGDNRKDSIVKREIFDAKIRGNYHVRFVLDDRPSVCRMWRSLGLPVFQVGDPHVEF